MKLENLNPVVNGNYNCFDKNILLPICNWYGIDCSAYFLDSFLIVYTSCGETSLLDNKNMFFGSDYKYELLGTFSGLKRERYIIDDNNRYIFKERIINSIKNRKPIGILIDAYCCHWNEYFHKFHRNHVILLIGYDAKAKEFLCIDGYITRQKQRISVKLVISNYIRIYEFDRIAKVGEIYNANLFEIMYESATNLPKYSTIQGLETMKSDILNAFDCVHKYNTLFLENSIFLLKIRQAGWSRCNISEIIHNCFSMNKDLRKLMSNLLLEEAGLWNKLAIGLAKMCYAGKGSEYLLRLADILEEIIVLNQKETFLIKRETNRKDWT